MPEPQNPVAQSQGRVTAYYSEQQTAAYCRLELQVIQYLADAGIINAVQIVGEAQPCYNDVALALLRRARRLYQDLGVNLEGVEIILRLAARIEMLQRELVRYQALAERSVKEQQVSNDALDQPGAEEQRL
jgi:DNA-binding transcriptional MerR regulator